MTKRRICILLLLLLLMFLLIFSLNFYFLTRLNEQIQSSRQQQIDEQNTQLSVIEILLNQKLKQLKPVYLNKNPRYFPIRGRILRNFYPKQYDNVSELWKTVNNWPIGNEIYPEYDSTIGKVLHALQTEDILKARNSPRGTQLKLLFELTGSQIVLFKPKWYSRGHIVRGPVYAGKDRHTAEIFGFYLGTVLNLRQTPLVAGRKINLKEVYEKGDLELRRTMLIEGNGTRYCVYGKCYYCRSSEKICGDVNDHSIEGVMLHVIPGTFVKNRSPWQRTYKEKEKAKWEDDENYCESLKQVLPETRLLDLVDAAIFDFLIQNGDRHHYETLKEGILLLDNGKGFGNPYTDFIDILAPLYQCCILRRTTWTRLVIFSGGALTELIENLTKFDQLYPILTEEHFKAVERRLLIVFSMVEICFDKYGRSILR